jgi:hypothetical protein
MSTQEVRSRAAVQADTSHLYTYPWYNNIQLPLQPPIINDTNLFDNAIKELSLQIDRSNTLEQKEQKTVYECREADKRIDCYTSMTLTLDQITDTKTCQEVCKSMKGEVDTLDPCKCKIPTSKYCTSVCIQ